ncbi:universal stress protein [Natrarchaeobaculum sulfurireducens]|uniref:Nucleotide-binding protein, UspA family n=1 Tax=Natrarchaeobaculum sulfurireducens TaxID=2044521 RepID=A0A346PU41_9EURY|nr:universal stress protein [Natrarchaeobaculum sulfurireducens]AXR76997.1 Nucleotide-binding protein, UspA family [Natrarchaeobaculum sulfurireducens]AXR83036.1 Universal stress protein [Natrarchaeobaculum sulfurireducens]
MHTFLLPIDESETRAERAANTVLELPGSTEEKAVLLLNVSESTKQPWLQEFEAQRADGASEPSLPDSTNAAYQLLEEAGVAVETRLEEGDVTECILEVADDVDADSIIMSGRQKSATGKVLFGSITQSVLLNTDRPVTVLMSD